MTTTAVRRRMEILLVEDNLDDARTTIEALQNENVHCRVSLVLDGEEALAFLHQEGVYAKAPRPDLILLDMELPKKDGREVLREIREDPDLEHILVIVLTASAVHRAVLAAQNLRVEGYMTKPVGLEQFIIVIKSMRKSWLTESLAPQRE